MNASSLDESLVALAAGVGGLAWEMSALQVCPVESTRPSLHQCLVILGTPSSVVVDRVWILGECCYRSFGLISKGVICGFGPRFIIWFLLLLLLLLLLMLGVMMLLKMLLLPGLILLRVMVVCRMWGLVP
jgi:hypothetical protein